MLRILILALLISTPAFAQDATKLPTIVVQPAPVVLREMPPAQVNMSPWPHSLQITQPQAAWWERYQTLLAGILALIAGAGAYVGARHAAGATLVSTKHLIQAEEDRRRATEAADLRALAGAFLAEITTLAQLARDRLYTKDAVGNYVNGAFALAVECRRQRKSLPYSMPITRDHYTPIYSGYANKVGAFPDPIPEIIVKLYTKTNSIFDTLRGHYENFYETDDYEWLAEHYDWFGILVDQAVGEADAVIPLLRAFRNEGDGHLHL